MSSQAGETPLSAPSSSGFAAAPPGPSDNAAATATAARATTTKPATDTAQQERKPPAVATPPKDQPSRDDRHRDDEDSNDQDDHHEPRGVAHGGHCNNLLNEMNSSSSLYAHGNGHVHGNEDVAHAAPAAQQQQLQGEGFDDDAGVPPSYQPPSPPPAAHSRDSLNVQHSRFRQHQPFHPPLPPRQQYQPLDKNNQPLPPRFQVPNPPVKLPDDPFARTMKAWKGRAGNYRDYSHLDEDDVLQNLAILSSPSSPRDKKKCTTMQKDEKINARASRKRAAVAAAPTENEEEDVKPAAKKNHAIAGGGNEMKNLNNNHCATNATNGSNNNSNNNKANSNTNNERGNNNNNNNNFPMKLHQILSSDEHINAIVWLPHGRAWKVVDMNVLEREVLPKFFNHRRRESFRRQVDCWNFKRIVRGADAGAYYHEKFLRGMPHISLLMSESKKAKRPMSHSKMLEILPDYYAVTRANPLPQLHNREPDGDVNVDAVQLNEENRPTIVVGDAVIPSSKDGDNDEDSFSSLVDDNPPDFYANPMPPCRITDAEEDLVESDMTDDEEYERRRNARIAYRRYERQHQLASAFFQNATNVDGGMALYQQYFNHVPAAAAAGVMFAAPAPMMPAQYLPPPPPHPHPAHPAAYPPVAYMLAAPAPMMQAQYPGFPPPPHPHPAHPAAYPPVVYVYPPPPPPAMYAAYPPPPPNPHMYPVFPPVMYHDPPMAPINPMRMIPARALPVPDRELMHRNGDWEGGQARQPGQEGQEQEDLKGADPE